MPRYSLLQIARDQNTVRVNQSPSQDCRKNKKTNRVTGVLNNLSKNLDGSFLKHIWTLQVETPVDCNSSVNGTKQTIWHTKRINYMKLIFTTNTFKILEKGRDLHVLLPVATERFDNCLVWSHDWQSILLNQIGKFVTTIFIQIKYVYRHSPNGPAFIQIYPNSSPATRQGTRRLL